MKVTPDARVHLAPSRTAACSRHAASPCISHAWPTTRVKVTAAKGIAAAIVAGDQRCVESAHQNVIPEGRGVAQVGVGRGQRGSGPGERECVRAAHIVGLDHVAALIHIQPVRGVGGIARRIEHTGGGERISCSPAHHLAARGEIEVAGRQANIGLFHAQLNEAVSV